MKKKLNQIILVSLFALMSFVFIYDNPVSGMTDDSELSNDKDFTEVENSIIISGLRTDAGTPVGEDDLVISGGTIIYDDAFDDTIIDYKNLDNVKTPKIRKKYKAKRTSKKRGRTESIIEKLKKKDNRWHLTSHRIREGENLWVISKKFNTDYRLIIKINKIGNPDRLNAGKTILIPNKVGVEYTIKKGDTLYNISRRYGVDMNKIISHNKIRKDIIKTGKTIFIPDAASVQKKSGRFTIKKDYGKIPKQKKRRKFIWPLKGKITSAFGNRINPISRKRRFHCGVDISAPVGTAIKASANGKVIFSGWKHGYGKVVIIRHNNGYITIAFRIWLKA